MQSRAILRLSRGNIKIEIGKYRDIMCENVIKVGKLADMHERIAEKKRKISGKSDTMVWARSDYEQRSKAPDVKFVT